MDKEKYKKIIDKFLGRKNKEEVIVEFPEKDLEILNELYDDNNNTLKDFYIASKVNSEDSEIVDKILNKLDSLDELKYVVFPTHCGYEINGVHLEVLCKSYPKSWIIKNYNKEYNLGIDIHDRILQEVKGSNNIYYCEFRIKEDFKCILTSEQEKYYRKILGDKRQKQTEKRKQKTIDNINRLLC